MKSSLLLIATISICMIIAPTPLFATDDYQSFAGTIEGNWDQWSQKVTLVIDVQGGDAANVAYKTAASSRVNLKADEESAKGVFTNEKTLVITLKPSSTGARREVILTLNPDGTFNGRHINRHGDVYGTFKKQ